MRTTAPIILLSLLTTSCTDQQMQQPPTLACFCFDTELNNSVPIACEDAGSESDSGATGGPNYCPPSYYGTGTDTGSTSSVADSTGAGSTSGGTCDPMLVRHECRLMRAWVKYAPDGERDTQGTLNGGPTHCAVGPNDVNVNQEEARSVTTTPICNGPESLMDYSQACVDRCEEMIPADFGMPDEIDDQGPGLNETWQAQVVCLGLDGPENNNLNDVGLGNNAIVDSGSCDWDFNGNGEGWDTWTTATGLGCNDDECVMASTPEECWDYYYESFPSYTTSGNHIYALLDYDYVQGLYGNTAPLFQCEGSRYSFYDDEVYIYDVNSLLYRLGLRTKDKDLQAWEHDSSYNRVGSLYTLDTMTNALDAFGNLIPAPDNEIHVTIGFKRKNKSVQLHVDVE